MQSKGKLGSILAGVIAVLMVLVCAFYLSFTFVNNNYEEEAVLYAQKASKGAANPDEAYNKAYKDYLESKGEENVYLGYTLNEIRPWGVNLGLDLKGGMNVILQVDMPDMLSRMSSVGNDSTFMAALDRTQKTVKDGDFVGNFIKIYREEAQKSGKTVDLSLVFPGIKQGAGDDEAVAAIREQVKDMVNTSATQTLRKRIDQFGVVSPNIQVLQGNDGQILLELPGVKDHQRVRDLLQKSAALEFYATYNQNEVAQDLNAIVAEGNDSFNTTALARMLAKSAGKVNPGYAIVGYADDKAEMAAVDSVLTSPQAQAILAGRDMVLSWGVKPEVNQDAKGNEVKLGYALYALHLTNGAAALDGEVVTDARADQSSNQLKNELEVSMTMNSEGARDWERITDANKGRAVAIVLDGLVYSAPNVKDAISGGRSSISGNFTVDEANDLANVLKAGKMKAKVVIISDMVIGPSLGQQAIDAGMISFIVALVLLMIFMCAFYGLIPGLITNLCLIFNLFFTFGILASFQAVLTLSGICGIVLSLGMAVDANVLIFERAKEEMRAGKGPKMAIADGYSNAFSAIFDSNLTSIITGVILLFFGTGPIKGFATTLIIGIVCSFFTAVYLSRLFFMWIGKTKAMNSLTFSTAISRKMFVNSKINFLGKRNVGFAIAMAFVVVFVGSLVWRGLNQGIDFSGGRNYIVKFDNPVDTEEIKDVLSAEFPNSTVTVIKIESSNQIRVSTNYKIDEESQNTETEITGKLYKAFSDLNASKSGTDKLWNSTLTEEQFSTTDADHGLVSSQKVGPTVASDMRADAYIAVSLAIIAMFLYILIRFRNVAFSVGAVCAVAFTAFAIIGFYSIFWGVFPFAMEVDQSFIAAILTVIGYQINDTVVVFDRVRENVTLFPKQDFYSLVNKSLNSTLGRTIMTSLSTLLVLVCIFILGGDSIRSFVFAMILGVIVGTLATLFVATPVAYLVNGKFRKKKNSVVAA
ncbi:MAG: protein translocase subunit SecD [Bacteroidales bacterium]|nr:protein translocase subunit SecD [Bacteroidales bacterium]